MGPIYLSLFLHFPVLQRRHIRIFFKHTVKIRQAVISQFFCHLLHCFFRFRKKQPRLSNPLAVYKFINRKVRYLFKNPAQITLINIEKPGKLVQGADFFTIDVYKRQQ